MSTPDWDRQLAKIDKQLAALPDDEPARPQPARAGGAPAAPVPRPERRPTTAFGVYGRLALSIALGVSMLFWPYPYQCGFGLFGYLAGAATVLVAGIWSAGWTWRHRTAPAHVVALLVAVWGLVLGGMQVLPRIGYAVPTAGHPAAWVCR
ncbi:MAG TPA: hypothetical protein VFW98_18670 [Gemmatimonadaceae bacterium]|nr:hypothetical protein [Gemmatimonadaceae bacterium]